MKDDIANGPNTFSRGSGRIDYTICSETLLYFGTTVSIFPFGVITLSDHRIMYLNISLNESLRNPNVQISTGNHIF